MLFTGKCLRGDNHYWTNFPLDFPLDTCPMDIFRLHQANLILMVLVSGIYIPYWYLVSSIKIWYWYLTLIIPGYFKNNLSRGEGGGVIIIPLKPP